jgi:hypothetical protein
MAAASANPQPTSRRGRAPSSPIARTADRPRALSRYSASATGRTAKKIPTSWYVRSRYGRADWLTLRLADWSRSGVPAVSRATMLMIA